MAHRVLEFFKLTVPEYMPFGLLSVLVGLFLSANQIMWSPKIIYSILAVAFLIGAYNSFNAILDKEIDKINKPHRPLPRDALTIREALYFSVILFITSILFSALINNIALILTVVAALISILYSLPGIELKKRLVFGTLSANCLYTVLFPLIGWSIFPNNPIPIALVIFLFFFGIGAAILKDFEDIIGDNHHRAHNLLSHLGFSNTLILIVFTIILDAVILVVAIRYDFIKLRYILGLIFNILLIANLYTILYRNRDVAQSRKVFLNSVIIIIGMEITFLALSLL